MHRGGARADGEDVLGLEVRRPGAPRAERPRGPVVSQPERSVSATAATSSSPIAGGWKPSRVLRRVRIDPEAYGVRPLGEPARAPRPRSAPRREHGARAVGAAPERAEDVPRAAVDPHPSTPRHGLRLVDALDLDAAVRPAGRGTRRRRRPPGAGRAPTRPADRPSLGRSPSAAATARRVEVDAGRAAQQSSASWPPPSRAATSITTGPSGAETKLRVRRARSGSRAPPPPRRATATTGSTSWTDGQTWASATPNAGGSAVSRSVTVSGTKRPSSETAFTVTSGPSTCSSTSTHAAAGLRERRRDRALELVRPADERRARAGPAGRAPSRRRATGAPGSRGSSARACGTPASANALALPRLRRGDRAGARVDRVRRGRSAPRPAPRSRRASPRPGETIPSTSRARASRSTASSSSDESTRALVGEREPDGLRVAVDGDHVEVAARPGRLEQAELGGPGA